MRISPSHLCERTLFRDKKVPGGVLKAFVSELRVLISASGLSVAV